MDERYIMFATHETETELLFTAVALREKAQKTRSEELAWCAREAEIQAEALSRRVNKRAA